MVITDLNMPNVDGYTLIDTLRQNNDYAETPIIILSSEEEEADKERGRAVGASSYLVKPFRPDALLAEVGKFLELTSIGKN
jgi:two-component system chemotaxis response regulator CheY